MTENDAKLNDEHGRLAALRRYEILDTPREAPFEKITGLVQAVLNVPIATVSLIDEDRQWYKSCAGMEGGDLPREQSFCTHTIRSREPLVIPDTLLDQRFASYPTVLGEPFIRSYVGVPFASPDGYNLGSLCALDRQPRNFQPAQIEVLKSFASLVVDELELRRIAQFDSLTGAITRRSFLLELDKAIADFQREQTPATLLVMDIDHFKRINDSFGHPAGDIVLQDVSHVLRSLLRKGDLFGRLGGEEFGILLRNSPAAAGEGIADKLREAVQRIPFAHEPSRPVTASFGIKALSLDNRDPELWLARADEALYSAKRNGRNRCCVLKTAELVEAPYT